MRIARLTLLPAAAAALVATGPSPAEEPAAAPHPAPPAVRRAVSQALGVKSIPTPPAGTWGLVSEGDGGGGIFRDSDSEAEAWLGTDGYGARAYGSLMGGHFADADDTSWASLGYGGSGISASGIAFGGQFRTAAGTGGADLAFLDTGVYGFGSSAGGCFEDSDGSGFAFAAYERPLGSVDRGGDPNDGDYGVYAGGLHYGGYFESGSAYTYLATDSVKGVDAYGNPAGSFHTLSGDSRAYLAGAHMGVFGEGLQSGGYFQTAHAPMGYPMGWTWIGYERPVLSVDPSGTPNDGGYGVYAQGVKAGGYFEDGDDSSYAYVATTNYGVYARGSYAGGDFADTDSSGWARAAHGSYKIYGTGAVSFVQNHPANPNAVIVYAAPEGDEVATYTRGTARLANGEARVALGQTFRWVTNPDLGLTAHLTPRGDPVPLAVVELTPETLVVRGPANAPDGLVFDYLVYGLRIGFEESAVVQEKEREALIPSMADHRELAARRPDLAAFTALARWTDQRETFGLDEPLDLSRADALRDLIGEHHPAPPETVERRRAAAAERAEHSAAAADGRTAPRSRVAPAAPAVGLEELEPTAPIPAWRGESAPTTAGRDIVARSFRPSAGDLASLLAVSEPVAPGDVLSVDPERPGMLRLAATTADPTVVGVVASEPGLVLGSNGGDGERRAAVTFAGIASCKVDAIYGPVYPGDLLVSSPTPGHAMRADAAPPGAVLGKALEELTSGRASIRILVMAR